MRLLHPSFPWAPQGEAGETPIVLKGSRLPSWARPAWKNTSFPRRLSPRLPNLAWETPARATLTSPLQNTAPGPGNRCVLELRINQKSVGPENVQLQLSIQLQAKLCFHCQKGGPAILVSPRKRRRFDSPGLNRGTQWPRRPAFRGSARLGAGAAPLLGELNFGYSLWS